MTKIGYNNGRPTRIPIRRVNCGYYIRWYYNGWHYWNFLQGTSSEVTAGEKYRTTGSSLISFSSGQITQEQVRAIRTLMNAKEVQVLTISGYANCKINPASLKIYDRNQDGYEIEFSANIGSREVSKDSPIVEIPIVPPTPDPSICTITIGTQEWMCKNYDSEYPGSKVYDNDEANRPLFGGLYSYNQVTSSGFCPPGYRIPTIAEWRTLIDYVGGSSIAGGKLKRAGTTEWSTPNTDGENAFGFDALAGGYFGVVINEDYTYRLDFLNLHKFGYFWAASPTGSNMAFLLSFDTGAIIELPYVPATDPTTKPYFSVRLIKNAPDTYIGNGALYNWFSVATGLLAPDGWHVAQGFTDVQVIMQYLSPGGTTIGNDAGIKMKEAGLTHWNTPNAGATNSSGFNGLGSGARDGSYGTFNDLKEWLVFWSPSLFDNDTDSSISQLTYNTDYLYCPVGGQGSPMFNKKNGASVRCVKDTTTLTNGQTGTMTDIDGNIYPTICIGTKEFMASNLKVTKYNDGRPIPEVTDNTEWGALTTPGRCWYNNIPE